MEKGACKLCLKHKPICLSHLIPKAMYDYCWNDGSSPVLFTGKEIGPSEEQLTAYLLCSDCENGLNRDGENWLLPKLARLGGPFPFYDLVVKGVPDVVEHDFAAYACSRNPAIAFRKLTNFVIGVFWKTSVYAWRTGRVQPRIELGPYRESFRKFLNHEARFPRNTHLMAVVSPPDKTVVGFNVPEEKQRHPFRQYVFNIPGMSFVLGVGKGMDDGWQKMCFYTDPLHPIIVADISRSIFQAVHRASRKAVHVDHPSRIMSARKK